MNKISKNLKFLLNKERVSENELSKKIGVPQQVLNRLISGINLNPKITTISQVANYFNLPLQELIYGDLASDKNLNHIKVPFISFADLPRFDIDTAISSTNKFLTLDIETNGQYFATDMHDDSMEPKFPFGSILIFEKSKNPANGDFCLLRTENNEFFFRQVLFGATGKKHIKCLNPQFDEYKLALIPINFYVLATLLESRVSFTPR